MLTWTEADVARVVLTKLQRQGFETYQEVSTGYGSMRADIVGVRGALVAVVETKVGFSLRLCEQLLRWLGSAHLVIGAVRHGGRGHVARRWLRHEGIGLWTCGTGSDGSVVEDVSPRLWRRAGTGSIRHALCEEQRTGEFAAAGTSGGGYWTPFRNTTRALTEVVTREPGITLRAALQQVQHHYASDKSAIGSIPGLIRKGVIAGVRLDDTGRQLRLYPVSPAGEAHPQ